MVLFVCFFSLPVADLPDIPRTAFLKTNKNTNNQQSSKTSPKQCKVQAHRINQIAEEINKVVIVITQIVIVI
jgi:hypothetical protein